MLLHTVSQSPHAGSALNSCLRAASRDSCILLLEDAVYAACVGSTAAAALLASDCRVFALQADLKARGISSTMLVDSISVVDYSGFVQLSVDCHAVQSWY